MGTSLINWLINSRKLSHHTWLHANRQRPGILFCSPRSWSEALPGVHANKCPRVHPN